jgi:cell division protease FtsH
LNRKVLDALAKSLMEEETLNQEQIAVIFKNIKKLPQRTLWLSKKSRPVSKVGPIAIPEKGSTISKEAAIAADAAPKATKPRAVKPRASKPRVTKPAATKAGTTAPKPKATKPSSEKE